MDPSIRLQQNYRNVPRFTKPINISLPASGVQEHMQTAISITTP